MPRTKFSKNTASKRNRASANEELLLNKLKDLDEMAEHFRQEIDLRCQQKIDEISEMVAQCKAATPRSILQMKWGDLIKLSEQGLNPATCPSVNLLQASTSGSSNNRKDSSLKSSTDDGYKSKSSLDSDNENCGHVVKRPLQGPFEASKRRRRSRSVEPVQVQLVGRRPASNYIGMAHLGGAHMPRSKTRTPMNHIKSNSSDRAYNPITPKVDVNAPLMILRHARVGEKVFSLSGSPVVTTNAIENIANVNIPIHDNILSIRPTEMGKVDENIFEHLHPETFEHLKMLKINLDAIMRVAEQKWGHQ